jgi:DNA-directed RNA polymerase specialized sigma24 family protein
MSEQQLDAFYRDVFLPLVRRATWKHHLSKEDASDVVQDAFVLALEKIDCAGNPKAWLVQVVDHLALNLNRKAIRRTKLTSRWTSSNSNTPFSLDANGEAIVE